MCELGMSRPYHETPGHLKESFVKKIAHYAAITLLTLAAGLSTVAVSQVLKTNSDHAQVAGGNPPPSCNPLIENCPPKNGGE